MAFLGCGACAGPGIGPAAFCGAVANALCQRLGQLFLPGATEIAGRNRQHALAGSIFDLSLFATFLQAHRRLRVGHENGNSSFSRHFHRSRLLVCPEPCSQTVFCLGACGTCLLDDLLSPTDLFRSPIPQKPAGIGAVGSIDRQSRIS